jgi:hypothetical protein
LLLKVRRTGDELEIATIGSIAHAVSTANMRANDKVAPAAVTGITPPEEADRKPAPPIEANPVRESAPNEANSRVQAPSSVRHDRHKELRIDTPHLDHKAAGIGKTGKETIHPALERVLRGREATLLDLSPIFGK